MRVRSDECKDRFIRKISFVKRVIKRERASIVKIRKLGPRAYPSEHMAIRHLKTESGGD